MIDKSRVKSHLPEIGRRVRSARLTAVMTQRELAARADMTEGAIRQIELGRRNMGVGYLPLICDALGVSPNFIVGDVLET